MSNTQERLGRNTGLPVLSGDYIRGYTKALMDVQEMFRYLQQDAAFRGKQMNWKKIDQLMKCVIANRDAMRENSKGFFRWNKLHEKFEWFEGKDK